MPSQNLHHHPLLQKLSEVLNDKTAFYAFVDRFTSEASPETFDIPKSHAEVEEVEILMRKKLAQLQQSE